VLATCSQEPGIQPRMRCSKPEMPVYQAFPNSCSVVRFPKKVAFLIRSEGIIRAILGHQIRNPMRCRSQASFGRLIRDYPTETGPCRSSRTKDIHALTLERQ
jgi:hypothetical protein